jgi:predicted nucleic acid-binding protein
LVADAVIVALCREHGVDTVLTHDRDFDRFSDIRVARLGC